MPTIPDRPINNGNTPPSPDPERSHRAPSWRVWLLAARMPTLPAAVVPVVVGTAAAAAHGHFRPAVLLAALISSLLIQIGTNFANDLFDFRKGADTEKRTGPVRVTQAGLLTPTQVAKGMWLSFALSVAAGLYLIWIGGWPILAVGVAGIAAGILYTGGPWPLGYNGLGDLFVFVFFGLIAVSGTFYVHADGIAGFAILVSVPVALLVTAILVVNNLRDIETDRAAGKRTLAVRLGRRGTQAQYIALVACAYLIPGLLWLAGSLSSLFWLPWLTLPLGLNMIRLVLNETGPGLNPALKGTSRLHLLFGTLFAVSLLW